MGLLGSAALSKRERLRQSRRGVAVSSRAGDARRRAVPHRGSERPPRARRGRGERREDRQGARESSRRSMLGLDKERGGDLAQNLERLYDYASRTLLKANLENRSDLLKEVTSLLREIKLGWDGIAPAARPKSMNPLVAHGLDLTDQVQAAIDGGRMAARAGARDASGGACSSSSLAGAGALAISARRSRRSRRATTAWSGSSSITSAACCARRPSRARRTTARCVCRRRAGSAALEESA